MCNCIRFDSVLKLQAKSELDLSSLGLLTLYSEVHPTISYIVHYGISVVAPVYKLQVSPYLYDVTVDENVDPSTPRLGN